LGCQFSGISLTVSLQEGEQRLFIPPKGGEEWITPCTTEKRDAKNTSTPEVRTIEKSGPSVSALPRPESAGRSKIVGGYITM